MWPFHVNLNRVIANTGATCWSMGSTGWVGSAFSANMLKSAVRGISSILRISTSWADQLESRSFWSAPSHHDFHPSWNLQSGTTKQTFGILDGSLNFAAGHRSSHTNQMGLKQQHRGTKQHSHRDYPRNWIRLVAWPSGARRMMPCADSGNSNTNQSYWFLFLKMKVLINSIYCQWHHVSDSMGHH